MIPRSSLLIALLIVALIPTGVMGADQTLIGGDQGYYLVNAGVDGATVTFDGTVMGTTQNGVLKVQVYTTATPYRTFTVTKAGYQTYNGQITDYPAKDQTVDLIATLQPLTTTTTTTQTLIGGDQGYYLVHAGVDGATVTFDDTVMGTTQNGVLKVQVYTTATPFRNVTVTKAGYQTYNGQITDHPAKGQTVDLYATLQPLTTSTVTATATNTQTLIGGDQGYYLVHAGVDGATVTFDGTMMGTTQNGVLKVQVYTTATPFRNFTVTKTGYQTYNGQITDYPAKDQTIDLYATLQPLTTTVTTSSNDDSSVIGGDQGWYLVHSNVDGTAIAFDGTAKGTIQGGVLKVQVYTTGTPYKTFTATKNGYQPFSGQITSVPSKGGIIDLYANLTPLSTTTTTTTTVQTTADTLIGGDQGWYLVHSNAEGANVSFDSTPEGTITNGTLKVMVYVTGTPFKNITVTREGFSPLTMNITTHPAKGETVDITANLTPLTPTTTQKSGPELLPLLVGLGLVGLGLHRKEE
jgi:hypothetical protein